MLRTILLASCAIPLIAKGQELPYPVVFALQRAADSASEVDGVVCQLKMRHRRDGDTRPFKVTLVSPKGRSAVKISPDGSFSLPTVPEGDRNYSKLVHDLEKGALATTFGFQSRFRCSLAAFSGKTGWIGLSEPTRVNSRERCRKGATK